MHVRAGIMGCFSGYLLIVGILLCFSLARSQIIPQTCSSTSECGWEAVCQGSQCACLSPLVLHENGKDCQNTSCGSKDCLQCESPDSCNKCVSFISQSTSLCLSKCEGSAELQNGNLVCTESDGSSDDSVNLVVAVVAGAAAGAVLCVIVIVAVCIYVRRNRRNINLQTKSYASQHMESGRVKQFPMYDNSGFETDSQADYTGSKIDPQEYVTELDKLRPHADTLMVLLSQVRGKTRAMNVSDPRIPTYKGVVHQLCRVLVLLHKKDPVVSIPSDALGLIQWARQMLEDHMEQQSSSGGTMEIPIAQISEVDMNVDTLTGPVYATPDGSQGQGSPISLSVATPYSSVPVPLTQNHYSSGSGTKRPGFATISRMPSIPNGDLIKSLDAHDDTQDNRRASTLQKPDSEPPKSSFLRKEDFQSFLINSGEKSDVQSGHDHSSDKENVARHSELVKPGKGKGKLAASKSSNPSVERLDYLLSHSSNSFQQATPPPVANASKVKKNIITNPNAIKKSSSVPAKTSKAISTPGVGYFANGHYYEPNPNPMPNTDGEVYAPGSSYSDRSIVMSTFLGDLPRSTSQSASSCSGDGDAESDNSGGDLDVFPFDLKDATDPVEV